ncbi:MAG: biopolymer transporter ExbD [Pseudomonadota bacterium]
MNEPTLLERGARENWAPIARLEVGPMLGALLALVSALLIAVPHRTVVIDIGMVRGCILPNLRDIPQIVVLEVDFDGTLSWDGATLRKRQDLTTRLKAVAAQENQAELHVRANPLAPYPAVAAVLAEAQDHGLQKIGLIN